MPRSFHFLEQKSDQTADDADHWDPHVEKVHPPSLFLALAVIEFIAWLALAAGVVFATDRATAVAFLAPRGVLRQYFIW